MTVGCLPYLSILTTKLKLVCSCRLVSTICLCTVSVAASTRHSTTVDSCWQKQQSLCVFYSRSCSRCTDRCTDTSCIICIKLVDLIILVCIIKHNARFIERKSIQYTSYIRIDIHALFRTGIHRNRITWKHCISQSCLCRCTVSHSAEDHTSTADRTNITAYWDQMFLRSCDSQPTIHHCYRHIVNNVIPAKDTANHTAKTCILIIIWGFRSIIRQGLSSSLIRNCQIFYYTTITVRNQTISCSGTFQYQLSATFICTGKHTTERPCIIWTKASEVRQTHLICAIVLLCSYNIIICVQHILQDYFILQWFCVRHFFPYRRILRSYIPYLLPLWAIKLIRYIICAIILSCTESVLITGDRNSPVLTCHTSRQIFWDDHHLTFCRDIIRMSVSSTSFYYVCNSLVNFYFMCQLGFIISCTHIWKISGKIHTILIRAIFYDSIIRSMQFFIIIPILQICVLWGSRYFLSIGHISMFITAVLSVICLIKVVSCNRRRTIMFKWF